MKNADAMPWLGRWLPAMALVASAAVSASAAAKPVRGDATEAQLSRCLAAPAGMSTAGQTECETVALRSYDLRMNAAYAALIHRLPTEAATRLRLAQRAWLAFRDADDLARAALYETRQGTMYVPMQAAAQVDVVRSRALQLEVMLRVMGIDD